MLESKKLELRRSKIREEIAVLAGKETRDENENRAMDNLETEYAANEKSYRGFLIAEESERSEAGAELENRSEKEYAELVDRFELRQVAGFLDDGSPIDGQTLEVIQEMRSSGSYQGVPIPLQALEIRAGESLAANSPDPISTRPLTDRLFPTSVMGQMGGNTINIASNQSEHPICTQGAVASWGDGELADIGAAVEYQTIDRPLKPDNNLGCQMILSRRTLKQAGSAIEAAVRRDMNSAIGTALDKAVFLGTGANGQPLGLIPGAATYGFTTVVVNAVASYSKLRSQATQFLIANAGGYEAVRLLMRTELLDQMDDIIYETGSGITELDRLLKKLGTVVTSTNALDAPAGSPLESTAVMTTTVNGVAPFTVGIWGGIDLVRDVYTKASSGQLVLTGIVTADVSASRAEQVRIITELQ